MTRLIVPLLLILAGLSGCADTTGPPPAGAKSCDNEIRAGLALSNSSHTVVALATDHGCAVVELYDSKAPITTDNFKKLVNASFYKDLLFHRIYKGFILQSGGMKTDGQFKESPYPPIKNEARTSGLKNLKYTLSMARGIAADSATNQFFINTADNAGLDPSPNNAGYAVFGIVLKGRPAVDAIENTPTTTYGAPGANPHCQDMREERSCPTKDVVLHSIRILK